MLNFLLSCLSDFFKSFSIFDLKFKETHVEIGYPWFVTGLICQLYFLVSIIIYSF